MISFFPRAEQQGIYCEWACVCMCVHEKDVKHLFLVYSFFDVIYSEPVTNYEQGKSSYCLMTDSLSVLSYG